MGSLDCVCRGSDAIRADVGLSAAHHAVLCRIQRLGRVAIPDLAALFALDRSAMSCALRPLEHDGLIAMVPDPGDRRARQVVLTSEGQALLAACPNPGRGPQARGAIPAGTTCRKASGLH